jgi:hypothetical protein
VEVGDDLHRSIRECLKRISLEDRVSNRLNNVKIELLGEMSPVVLACGESSVVSQTWLIEVPPALAPVRTSYEISVVTSISSPGSIASS